MILRLLFLLAAIACIATAQGIQTDSLRLRSNTGTRVTLLVDIDAIPYRVILPAYPGATGQALVWSGNKLAWQTVGSSLPPGTADGQLLRWDSTTSEWAVAGLSAGAGIAISNIPSAITITNTGDTDPSNDLTTGTTFGGDVSGAYNNLQLGSGVVGTPELADGAVTYAKLQNATGANLLLVS